MSGFACCDCIFCNCSRDEQTGLYHAVCSKGYTLANAHDMRVPQKYYAPTPRVFVPVTDPFGQQYFRTHATCAQFQRPMDATASHHFWVVIRLHGKR